MYLKQVRLKNILCFDDITLDFTREQKHCPWIVLLGENGTGKSTILQMIGLTLLGRDLIYSIAGGTQWAEYVRRNTSGTTQFKGVVETTLIATKAGGDSKLPPKRDTQEYHVAFELVETQHDLTQTYPKASSAEYKLLDKTLYSDDLTGGWFACGYGPWRKVLRVRRTGPSSQSVETSQDKPYRFATLFDDAASLTVVSDWLVALDYRSLKAGHDEASGKILELAINALNQMMRGVGFKEITARGDVIFLQEGVEVSIHHLSDGYRSTAAWTGDLVRRLVEAFPELDNPLQAEGVVLIDELDIHLHPKWQASVIEQARNLFPNLQFIVTSHSPFVAQDAQPEDKVIVLRYDKGHVVSQESALDIRGWRVDQILTSFLFDLKTTRDAGIRRREEEYQQLLDAQAQGRTNAIEEQRLEELKTWLEERLSPPGETLAENELYEVAKSFGKVLDGYLEQYK